MEFYKEAPVPTLSKYDIEFFRCREEGPFWVTRAHAHSVIEIIYIVKGDFEIDIDGDVSYAYPGDLVLIRSNAIHSMYHFKSGCGEVYVLKFTPQLLFNIFKGMENSDCIIAFLRNKKGDPTAFAAGEITSEIKAVLEKMIDEYNSQQEMMIPTEKAYACVFVVLLFKQFLAFNHITGDVYVSRDIIALIHKSVEYVNVHYASDITATECAKIVNLSYSYYAKMFRIIIGKTFKEYLTSIRLAKAHNILLTTDMPITDIAFSCGYNSHAHFSAEYKKYYGNTPSETRKKLIEDF